MTDKTPINSAVTDARKELLPHRCVQAWEKIYTLLRCSTDDAVKVIEDIADIANNALSIANQSEPVGDDGLPERTMKASLAITAAYETEPLVTDYSLAQDALKAAGLLEALAHIERLEAGMRSVLAAIKAAREMVPDEEEGLAAQIFAYHLNRADTQARALLAQSTDRTTGERKDG